MRSIRVYFENGNSLETSINGTDEEIRRYYLAPGQAFNLGDPYDDAKDNVQRAIRVDFLDLFREITP